MNPKVKKISDLIIELKAIKKENGDLHLVTGSDEEGNSYRPVYNMFRGMTVKAEELHSHMDDTEFDFESKEPNAFIIH